MRFCLSIGCCSALLIGCAARPPALEPDEAYAPPTPFVIPPCSEIMLPIELEVLRVGPEPRARKPSPNIRHYVVDLRIRRSGYQDLSGLWLLVDEGTFPSRVESVWQNTEDDVKVTSLGRTQRATTWSFSGGELAHAWPLGNTFDVTFANVVASTSGRRIPVTLGTITVGGVSPQEWARLEEPRRSSNGVGERPVDASIEPLCTIWIDLEARTRAEGSALPPPAPAAPAW